MLLTSTRASYRVVSSSLVFIALFFLLAVTLYYSARRGGVCRLLGGGDGMYRVHEVSADEGGAGSRRLKKFVLQENSGRSGDPELSWRNLSVKEVAGLWRSRGEFVETFISSIKEIGFEAVFFESVPVTRSTMVSGEGAAHQQNSVHT